MSNELELIVNIKFSDNIPSEEQKSKIVSNVKDALAHWTQHSEQGLAGDDFEGYTTEIAVENPNPEVGHYAFGDVWKLN